MVLDIATSEAAGGKVDAAAAEGNEHRSAHECGARKVARDRVVEGFAQSARRHIDDDARYLRRILWSHGGSIPEGCDALGAMKRPRAQNAARNSSILSVRSQVKSASCRPK